MAGHPQRTRAVLLCGSLLAGLGIVALLATLASKLPWPEPLRIAMVAVIVFGGLFGGVLLGVTWLLAKLFEHWDGVRLRAIEEWLVSQGWKREALEAAADPASVLPEQILPPFIWFDAPGFVATRTRHEARGEQRLEIWKVQVSGRRLMARSPAVRIVAVEYGVNTDWNFAIRPRKLARRKKERAREVETPVGDRVIGAIRGEAPDARVAELVCEAHAALVVSDGRVVLHTPEGDDLSGVQQLLRCAEEIAACLR